MNHQMNNYFSINPFFLLCIIIGIVLVFSAFPLGYASSSFTSKTYYQSGLNSSDDVEYWALLIAVGVYERVPEMNRPTMLREVSNFEEVLLSSSNFDSDHIKVIKAEDATVLNIYKGFRWLDEKEDENDFSLVYLTTHGFPHIWDRPPFDEADHRDEALASYRGFLPFESPFRWEHLSNPFGIILDDQFNYWFNQLESQGVGVVVDSCHSGGFNDYHSFAIQQTSAEFTVEFAKELVGQNRIVVTSVPEEEVSYGSYFSHYLIQGLWGSADTNHDGICSLEEGFVYSSDLVEDNTWMEPQIFDNYPGEFPVIIH